MKKEIRHAILRVALSGMFSDRSVEKAEAAIFDLENKIDAAIAAEREACAQIAEAEGSGVIAAAIRTK